MLTTRLCKLLGIQLPIFSAPLGADLAGPELVAAVSGAGGLGLMQSQLSPPEHFREQIRQVRSATDKPFGVNFILALPHEEDLNVCLEEHVPIVSFFWGDPARYVERVHAAGSKIFLQVGSAEAARRAAAAGWTSSSHRGPKLVVTSKVRPPQWYWYRGSWMRSRRCLSSLLAALRGNGRKIIYQ